MRPVFKQNRDEAYIYENIINRKKKVANEEKRVTDNTFVSKYKGESGFDRIKGRSREGKST